MGHANIYIRKKNEERWDSIADKSEWVNDLLAGNTVIKNRPTIVETPENSKTVENIKKDLKPSNSNHNYNANTRGSNGLCKIHETPLDDRGKCLVKGCRYG